jgi:carbamoyltransferase
LSISVDATGDFSTLECYFFNNLEVKLVYKKNFPDSLGFFYQALTQYLGFLEFGDEYKVMGLAAYGKPKYVDKLKKIINYDEKGNFKLNLKFFNFQRNIFNKEVEKVYFSSALEELIGRSRINNSIMTNYYADIAASVQFIFEDVLLKLLNSLYLKYNTNNLCLSGGCIQNSSFNGKIIKKTNFKNIYTTCSPGDSGGAIGAAASILFKNQILLDKKNYNNFLGRHYDNQYIMDNILEKTNSDFINYSRLQFPYLCKLIATKISKGKLIAWFQDKMEFGPRALGNRSILADPRNPNIKDLVNIKIKKREEFRPFAPSVLKEYASSFFNMDGIEEIPFMNIVVKVKEEKKNLIPGVVHFDETCRVHTVSKELNKKFHSLISEFYKITSIPLLLNTSLNIQGPIVESPIDAYNLFKNSDIDILVIEDFYFEKIKNVQKNT